MSDSDLTTRERMAIRILFWILRMANPTGYSHHVDNLFRDVMKEADRAKREGGE